MSWADRLLTCAMVAAVVAAVLTSVPVLGVACLLALAAAVLDTWA